MVSLQARLLVWAEEIPGRQPGPSIIITLKLTSLVSKCEKHSFWGGVRKVETDVYIGVQPRGGQDVSQLWASRTLSKLSITQSRATWFTPVTSVVSPFQPTGYPPSLPFRHTAFPLSPDSTKRPSPPS